MDLGKSKFVATGLVLCFFIGCVTSFKVPNKIRKNIELCYDKDASFKEELKFDIKGYYTLPTIYNHRADTFNLYFMFFEDGTCIYNFGSPYHTPKEYIQAVVEGEIPKLYGQQEGLYTIKSDTIVMQTIRALSPFAMPTWSAWEKRFKVLDNNLLIYISSKPLQPFTSIEMELFLEAMDNQEHMPAYFTPVDSVPDTDLWIKNQKWIHCKNH